MASHRYWRIYVTACYSSATTVELAEVGMYTTVGGSNVVSGGTASADVELDASHNAAKACDGNTSTYWVSGSGSEGNLPHWWKYDFGNGNDKDIVEFSIRVNNNGGNSPATFVFQYSDDGSTFTTSGSYTNLQLLLSNTYRFRATNNSKECWGLYVTESNYVSQITIAEIEFHTSVGGSDVTPTPTACPPVASATYEPRRAFSNDGTTLYFAKIATPPTPVRVAAYIGGTQDVVEYTVQAHTTYASSAPKAWNVQYSSDGGATWTTVVSETGQTGWTSGEIRTYSVGVNQTLEPTTGAVTVTGQTPSVGWTLEAGTGSAVVQGNVPEVSQGTSRSLEPGTGSVVVVGNMSGVIQGIDQTIEPVTGEVICSGETPEVLSNVTVFEPVSGSVVYTGYKPKIKQGNVRGVDQFFFG